jgi:hypothetical protein
MSSIGILRSSSTQGMDKCLRSAWLHGTRTIENVIIATGTPGAPEVSGSKSPEGLKPSAFFNGDLYLPWNLVLICALVTQEDNQFNPLKTEYLLNDI